MWVRLLAVCALFVTVTGCIRFPPFPWGKYDVDGDGYTIDDGDCAEGWAEVGPDAPEICNGVDDDCDGLIDNGADGQIFVYVDEDLDGFGTGDIVTACGVEPGFSEVGGDCDDGDVTIYPQAPEVCDGVDQDCDDAPDDGLPIELWYPDDDHDGFGAEVEGVEGCGPPEEDWVDATGDCDDGNFDAHPGAFEVCNGVDDDCDGEIDDGYPELTWTEDADGDGFGNDETAALGCKPPVDGYVLVGGDCDDADDQDYPGQTETCDGDDDDCDGLTDEDPPEWWRDGDGDGFGDPATSSFTCSPDPSEVAPGTPDCDDAAAATYPGAVEVCDGVDNDCAPVPYEADATDAGTYYADTDGDLFGDASAIVRACFGAPPGAVIDATDCDDAEVTVYPGAPEACDGLDHDCDGLTYEADSVDVSPYYVDGDGDGVGLDAGVVYACSAPVGYGASSGDCDDGDPLNYPGNAEVCDVQDNDCDGLVDDADGSRTGAPTWYRDVDGDLYGNDLVVREQCATPVGFVAVGGDCDDALVGVNPGASERCNVRDDDCDGVVDESDAVDAPSWPQDFDGDGFGDDLVVARACTVPDGYASTGGDCNDADELIFPGAAESCDAVDSDCDGVGFDPESSDAVTWWLDGDGDGYGADGSSYQACVGSELAGSVVDGGDCDDGLVSVNPGALEWCDAEDTDCDGEVMDAESEDATDAWFDGDGDGYGDPLVSERACAHGGSYVFDATDCDDGAAFVNPGQLELCNGYDDDCAGGVDEPSAADASEWYADADDDGHGDASSTAMACFEAPDGYVGLSDDCDDGASGTYPGAVERCDAVDTDCDGESMDDESEDATEAWFDGDGDGYGDPSMMERSCSHGASYVFDATDCDDGLSGVNPGASEVCNTDDDDCDGLTDEPDATDATVWYADGDSDGFGDASSTTTACFEAPSGYVGDATDCDPVRSDVYPGADEYCDSLDADCDGLVAESDSLDAGTWWADVDSDGYGDSGASTVSCAAPALHVAPGVEDCDDGLGSVYPGAPESCDVVDADCDGLTYDPESADAGVYWYDGDGDGYGDPSVLGTFCAAVAPGDYVLPGLTDCHPEASSANPGIGFETCNDGLDNDCDGSAEPCALSDLSVADADWQGTGGDNGDQFGSAMVGADLDGDGESELIVGAPVRLGAGAVYVVGMGDVPSGATSMSSGFDWLLTGNPSSQLGAAVAAGDLDGDGQVDLALAAPLESLSGRVYLISGPMGSGTAGVGSVDDVTITGTLGMAFGTSIAVSDVAAGAEADLIVGAPETLALTSGKVYLYADPLSDCIGCSGTGDATASLSGESSGALFGWSVSAVGDVDGSGVADVLIGAPGQGSGDGAVYLVLDGAFGAWDARYIGASSEEAGTSVAGGDLDGDGYADMVVGAPSRISGVGGATVMYGTASPSSVALSTGAGSVVGSAAGAAVGTSVSVPGDVNQDGVDDVMVGVPGGGAGSVALFYGPVFGPTFTTSADVTITGTSSGDALGTSLGSPGDVNGDGYPDLLVGAPVHDGGGTDRGQASLILALGL